MIPRRTFPAGAWAGGRSINDPQLSPDGSQVSFIYSSELTILDLDGGPQTLLPLFPKAKSHWWLPDGSGLVYAGTDSFIYRFDLATSACESITKAEYDISALSISPDGARLCFVDDFHDVLVADIADGQVSRISSDADFVFDPTWSPDSQWIAWHEWDTPNMAWDASRIVVRKSDGSGAIRTVAGGDGIGVQQPQFSPDGKCLGFLSDESGWLNVWAVDNNTFDNPTHMIRETWEHGGATWGPFQRSWAWHHNGDGILVCRNERGHGRLVAYDIATGAVWPNEDSDFHTGLFVRGTRAVAIRSGVARLPELELIDKNASRILFRGYYSGLGTQSVEPQNVDWRSSDGARINGRLYRAADTPTPMLVVSHGGPTDQSLATLYGRWAYFLERGWSILVVDYRGSTGWGREYTQALRGHWGVRDVEDVVAGAHYAVEQGWARPAALVAYGGSAGGFTTLLALIREPQLWAGGIAIYPVSDLGATAEGAWRYEAHYPANLLGNPVDPNTLFQERSPISHATEIQAPLLVLHGDSDIVVPPAQSKDLVEKLENAGRTVEFKIYEGEGHGWRRPETRVDELERVEAFLNRYVLDDKRSES